MIIEIDNYYLLSLGFAKASIADPEHILRQLRSINKQPRFNW